ncbi:MAG: 50S ribosomal protein L11 methyltransferase [Candidatus Marinimicrobia bacterium]|nr:50S ribosomal protein L11 methyltransferase [Candidatus Neomarinimicrobiota bacterium]MBT3676127.1 50S ribosomal protein L11 methyltransferase [Candidatus Neomarinimicrobiota bacterium]MBT3763032.1 50S ribosomal protein L11 methyltransferase [Candidatus Neomarinimicrobiota bacterium]MBT4068673.1 50S ribosomal protein L11 methyltransferase [Candidatus Neomarinimicrobiota bacterium]MBT4270738.1 50S ribosomal protein L11 methyltransferase [Candidatus Neomarinimicrobiota bacterium]
MNSFKNIVFSLHNLDLDAVCDFLMDSGVLSTSINNLGKDDSPNKTWFDEPGQPRWEVWEEPVVVALVESNKEAVILAQLIQSEFELSTLPKYSEESIADINWVRETQKINKPNKITDRLWIIPTGQSPIDKNAANIFLDPGVAFGTGNHATTKLCLEWLSENIQGGESVLDFGCGSGILAIAAIKLGAESAIGVDIDSQALKSTNENANLNGISIPTYHPDELQNNQKYDILIANILANPLVELLPKFNSLLHPNGRIAVSGIMESQLAKIIQKYKDGFSDLYHLKKDGWGLISGIK